MSRLVPVRALVVVAVLVGGLVLGPSAGAQEAPAVAATVRIETAPSLLSTAVTVTALDAAGAPVPATPVTVTRSVAAGTVPVAVLVTGLDGSASIVDPVPPLPAVTYRARLASGSMAVRTVELVPRLGQVLPALPGLAPLGDRRIPLPRFVDLAVDDAHDRLFISTGALIQVHDADGTQIGTVTGSNGAQALALSQDATTLFASGAGATGLLVVDTATMAVVGTMPLPGAPDLDRNLRSMDRAADRLVMLAYPQWPDGSMLLIPLADPGAGTASPDTWIDDYWLAGDPVHPRVITNGQYSLASGTLWDVSGAVAVPVEHTYGFPNEDPSNNTRDLRFSEDGEDVYIAHGAPYHAARVDPETFATRATYPIGAYPVAVAPTRDGLFVATSRMGYGDPAEVYDRLGLVRLRALPRMGPPGEWDNGFNELDTGALEFSRDSSRLYAVEDDNPHGDGNAALHVWANPLVPCGISLDGTLDALGRLDVVATVRDATGPVLDQLVELTVDTPAGPVVLGGLRTAVDGLLRAATTLATPLASVTVTATVQLPGAVAPCSLRAILDRPPTVPTLPDLLAVTTARGGLASWWLPPASTGGPPLVAYSMVVVDTAGVLRAWVNTGPTGFVAGARVPRGTYDVYVVAWNRLGLGAVAHQRVAVP